MEGHGAREPQNQRRGGGGRGSRQGSYRGGGYDGSRRNRGRGGGGGYRGGEGREYSYRGDSGYNESGDHRAQQGYYPEEGQVRNADREGFSSNNNGRMDRRNWTGGEGQRSSLDEEGGYNYGSRDGGGRRHPNHRGQGKRFPRSNHHYQPQGDRSSGMNLTEAGLNPNADAFYPSARESRGENLAAPMEVTLAERNSHERNTYSHGLSRGSWQNFNQKSGKSYGHYSKDYQRDSQGGSQSQHKFSRRNEVVNDEVEKDEQGSAKPEKNNSPQTVPQNLGRPKNQREVLIDQLSRNIYECMVCCEKVRFNNSVWSCKRCFNVFHLPCVRKWAASSADDSGWRCPGCQSYYESSPDGYYCFCEKTKNPKSSKYDVPHTCGQTCGKPNPGGLNCTHTCAAQCHPGPCPSCEVQQTRYCGCGKTSAISLCGSKAILTCGNVCNKTLECGVHHCDNKCHVGDCQPCDKTVFHECYCGGDKKEVTCTREANVCKVYSCSKQCGKPLSCGYHDCDKTCHTGPCGTCKTSVEAILSCPCGQTAISEACAIAKLPVRKKCVDPIPTCGKTCLQILPCGEDNERHRCHKKCHLEKKCPPCPLLSKVKCRCGSKVLEVPCKELSTMNEITCQKKCSKKRSCGKHKCNGKCCIDIDHICPIVCQRQLNCGNHTCTNLCHLNRCPPCPAVSFDELACECGASIIYPPVPCGTKRPPCHLPCSRDHPCDHPIHHPCHSEANCPPCTVLTEKWCHGKHELRKNIMCHITQVSCGMKCEKMLPCNRHSCPKICHAGACLENGEICNLPCDKSRSCGHPCGAPCHENECPTDKCKVMTDVVCPCGRRSDTLICWRREIEYDRTVTWEYHQELKKLETLKQNSVTIDDSTKQEIMAKMKETIPKSAVLECDKECARLERNRKLAEALQVDNADVTTSIGTPNYSEFLTKFAKKNPQFVEMIHKQLTDLVIKAKQSRKKNETYGFISMNRDKRHVVHEYSDHFGVLSESFDEEPNRNVVCFASKEKSYLPSVSLVDAVFRPASIRSERTRPNDDVTFRPEKRTQVVGPYNWSLRSTPSSTSNRSEMVALNNPSTSTSTNSSSTVGDFPPL